jgi:hypothetical protein
VIPRGELVQPLGQLHVRLVGGDREAEVGIPVELIPDRLHHARVAVPGVHHADPAGEVDQPVAVGIGEHRPFGVYHRDRGYRGHATRHRLGPAGQERAAGGTGNLGPELDDAGHGRPRGMGLRGKE